MRPTVAALGRVFLRPGLLVLGGGALLVSLHFWFSAGALLTIERPAGVEYVFISASRQLFFVLAATTIACVMCGHFLLRWLDARKRPQPGVFDHEDVAYARPLLLFGVTALAPLSLVPSLDLLKPVLLHLVVDLRWWWTAACVVWLGIRVGNRLDQRVYALAVARLRGLTDRRWLPEATLVVIVAAWVVVSTPHLRFASSSIGDEPKYLRYCETLYQGLGFDISELRPFGAVPKREGSHLWRNVALAARVMPEEIRDLAVDAATFVAHPMARFNRARRHDGFVEGKKGGLYQIYNPGHSLLMFPAYYVDRWFAKGDPNSDRQWPDSLIALNCYLLGLFTLWGIHLYRLLYSLVGRRFPAWLAAVLMMLSMPVSPFAFQFYPEVTSGLLLTAAGRHLLFPDSSRPARSFIYGVLAGYLPWMHVRFAPLSVVLLAAALFLLRSRPARVKWFVAGYALPWVCLILYVHRVTGSVIPTAMWTAEGGDSVLALDGIIRGSVAYLIDRDWGLFPHSPLYLFALPGYTWMLRQRPQAALLAAAAFLALLVPAAGHSLHAAGSTPMRLIVAVVPFGALPLVGLLVQYGRRPSFQVLFAGAAGASLATAFTYNYHFERRLGALVAHSVSGWNLNLLFPRDSRWPWTESAVNGWLYVAWLAAVVALLIAPVIYSAFGKSEPVSAPRWSRLRLAGVVTMLVLAAAVGVGAAGGPVSGSRYRWASKEAAADAQLRLMRLEHCVACISSRLGVIGTKAMLANLEGVSGPLNLPLEDDDAFRYAEWLAMPGRIRQWYADANGHEPADTDIGHFLYRWRVERTPAREIRDGIYSSARKGPGLTSGLQCKWARSPAAPVGLTVVAGRDGTVTASWLPPTDGVMSYVLEAGREPGQRDLTEREVGALSATIEVGNAPRYFVRVRAKNACGSSAPSDEVASTSIVSPFR